MKSKSITAMLASMLIFASCSTGSRSGYTISGDIRGLNDDSVIIYVQKYDTTGKMPTVDTIFCKAKDNKFSLQGNIDGPRLASVVLGGMHSYKSFTLFVENGTIQITGNKDSTDNIRCTGTPNNDLYGAENQREEKIYDQVRVLQQQLKAQDTADKQAADKQAYNKISNQVEGLRDSIINVRTRFVKENPNALAAGIYLYVLSDKIPLAQLETIYNAMGDDVKRSGHGMIVKQSIDGKTRTEIGKMAPAFSSTDTSGNTVSLASLRGKYVLLDFWASWCVPCRGESPYLVAAYKKYKDKGLEIVSVSLDNDPSKWKAAIRKDGLNWIHLSDLKAFNNEAAKLYGVQPIPDNFLIDPSGKIVARGLRGDDVEKKLSGIF